MKLTEEQAAIINAATTTNDNLLIIALAGAAKTTTLRLIAEAMPGTPAWCLAFNNSIMKEMADKLPANCEARTLNSLGNEAWRNYLGNRWVDFNKFKIDNIVRGEISRFIDRDREELTPTWSAEVVRAVKLGKNFGFLPARFRGNWEQICTENEFFADLDFTPTPLQKDLIYEVSIDSFRQAMDGKIDYDDQLFCPAVRRVSYEQKLIVLVDEAQDLTPVQHQMLVDIVANGRLIAVGDPCQAIYEFRGAMSDSMEQMKKRFDMREHRLTISFRCDKEIVRNARWRAPDMCWHDGAAEGEVCSLETWSHQDVPDNSAILCRNNVPLFTLFIKFLQAGRNAELVNRVFINDLIRIMESWQPRYIDRDEVMRKIDEWLSEKSERSLNTDFLDDQAACMRLFTGQANDLDGAIRLANNLAKQKGRIKLSTIHSSKGLEYDAVFILDRDLLSGVGQDLNLRYVAETRAKHNLTYITSSGYGVSNSATEHNQTMHHPTPTHKVSATNAAASAESAAANLPLPAEPTENRLTRLRRALGQRRERSRPRSAASSASAAGPESQSPVTTNQPEPSPRPFQINDRVRHRDFGEGIIRNIRKQRTIIDMIFDALPNRLRPVLADEIHPASEPLPEVKPGQDQCLSAANDTLTTDQIIAPVPAAAQPPPTSVAPLLKVGDKVRHSVFGDGIIQSLNKSRCRVLFNSGLPPCEVRKSDLVPVQ